jgi:hypothetical protein
MPTREVAASFWRDWDQLSDQQKQQFLTALRKFIEDLEAGGAFRRGLRVKAVERTPGVYELTWAKDGRATFRFGQSVRPGHTHIRWRRIGTHEILDRP